MQKNVVIARVNIKTVQIIFKKKKKDLLNSSGVTEIVELLKYIQKLKQVLKIYDRSFT